MPSSTSSSNLESPQGPWLRVWVVGLLLALAVIAGFELTFRYFGQQSGIASSAPLWSYHRDRLRDAGPNTIALLGASRMQLGFVPDAFLAVHPDFEIVQLAIAGDGPVAALRDLARDESFHGLVICSVSARLLQPSRWEDQQSFVDYFHGKWGIGERASLLLAVPLQEKLRVFGPRSGGRALFADLAGTLVRPFTNSSRKLYHCSNKY